MIVCDFAILASSHFVIDDVSLNEFFFAFATLVRIVTLHEFKARECYWGPIATIQ